MSTVFPGAIDAFANPVGTDLLENASAALDHDFQHASANDAIEALEAKVGIDGSAVTTSHDYKLSSITGTDKALSSGTGAGAQTIADLTLVDPIFTLGSDATGDMFYRNSGGLITRLPIGTTGQIIQASASGIPEYIANPAASDASTTVKGVVEIATTAEIIAGTSTGSTGAILAVPASAVGAAGASKLVQYDSSGKYPAADGSAITNISSANVGGGLLAGLGSATDVKIYNTFSIPWVLSTDVPSANFWTVTAMAATGASLGYQRFTSTGGDVSNGLLSTKPVGSIVVGGALQDLQYDSNKKVVFEFTHQRGAVGSEQMGWGFTNALSGLTTYNDNGGSTVAFTVDASGNLYAHTADGANQTATAITGVTLTANNTYRAEFNPGVNALFYVNGILKATVTTTLPNLAAPIKFGVGCSGNTSANDVAVAGPLWIGVEK